MVNSATNSATNCRWSAIKVIPKNWATKSASTKKDWVIYYRWYDQALKGTKDWGRQIFIRSGINYSKELKQRQETVKELIRIETERLNQGRNPITRDYPGIDTSDYQIHPDTHFIEALQKAKSLLKITPGSLKEIELTIKHSTGAINRLGFSTMPIKDVGRRHIKAILDHLLKTRPTFTNSTYNRYRQGYSTLFRELVQCESVPFNPVRDMLKMKTTIAKKEILTPAEIAKINTLKTFVHPNNNISAYSFWRWIHLFANSGMRISEFMKLQKSNIDLDRQIITCMVLKGVANRITHRPIKTAVLDLWTEIVQNAKETDYLFSEGLAPGINEINSYQIHLRWRRWVRDGLGINKTVYSLKHLNSTVMSAEIGTKPTSILNQHNEGMTAKIYNVNEGENMNKLIRGTKNPMG